MIVAKRGFLCGTMPLMALLVSGCGSNFDEILYQAFAATGRTAFDIFLTDLANDLADGAEGDDAAPDDSDGDGDDGTGDGGDTGNGGGSDGGGDTGGDGTALFAANCSACHGDDGGSGFAPDITGHSADEVIEAMSLTTHGSISLTDDELAAIAVFLGGDGTGDGGGSVDGDAAAGETIFTANGCGSCHCTDASGGCALAAPALPGVDDGTLDAVLRGDTPHTGGKHDLTDQDILDLQAYFDGLE